MLSVRLKLEYRDSCTNHGYSIAKLEIDGRQRLTSNKCLISISKEIFTSHWLQSKISIEGFIDDSIKCSDPSIKKQRKKKVKINQTELIVSQYNKKCCLELKIGEDQFLMLLVSQNSYQIWQYFPGKIFSNFSTALNKAIHLSLLNIDTFLSFLYNNFALSSDQFFPPLTNIAVPLCI